MTAMKKLFILLFIIFLFSCEKEAPDCWTCKIITEQTGEETTEFITMKCNISNEDIILFENDNTYTVIEKRDMGAWGTFTIITTKTTKCFK